MILKPSDKLDMIYAVVSLSSLSTFLSKLESTCYSAVPGIKGLCIEWPFSLTRKLEESKAESARASSMLQGAIETAEASKAAATERQKRFNLLNSQFKKREASLQKLVEEERAAGTSSSVQLAELSKGQALHEQVSLSLL